jgi:hypothetical protein
MVRARNGNADPPRLVTSAVDPTSCHRPRAIGLSLSLVVLMEHRYRIGRI